MIASQTEIFQGFLKFIPSSFLFTPSKFVFKSVINYVKSVTNYVNCGVFIYVKGNYINFKITPIIVTNKL